MSNRQSIEERRPWIESVRYAAAFIAFALVLVSPLMAAKIVIEHPLYDSTDIPFAITSGPDGALWFTEQDKNAIGHMTTSGILKQFALPAFDFAIGITSGPDGAVWFTTGTNIGRFTTSGETTEYPIPLSGLVANQVTTGPDGALWFTGNNLVSGMIGRVTTAGEFTLYSVPDQAPNAIASGPDGALWFTDSYDPVVGRITISGSVVEYPTSGPSFGITTGPDGALWFNEWPNSIVGRITTSGAVTEYAYSPGGGGFFNLGIQGIAAGPGGDLWFTSSNSTIGRVTTSGAFTFYGEQNVFLNGVAEGTDGAPWFTATLPFTGLSTIDQVVNATGSVAVSPVGGAPGTPVTVTGRGFSPAETVNIFGNSTGANLLGAVAADNTGSFSLTTNVGEAFSGVFSLVGIGQSSRTLGVAAYDVSSSLTLYPTEPAPGSAVTATGAGLQPGSQIRLFTDKAFLGAATVNPDGGFTLNFTVPVDIAEGFFSVYGTMNNQILVSASMFAL